MPRLPSSAGIALGPILFMIGLLGVLAAAMAGSSNGFGTASTTDSSAATVVAQANLIRTKINECHMQFLANGVDNSSSPPWDAEPSCAHDPYPCSDQVNGTTVSALTCPGDPLSASSQPNIWTGPRPTALPVKPAGFYDWGYMNAGSAGGRCIWILPTSGNSNSGLVAGLTKAAAKFSSQEASYLANSASQKLVIFITPASGAVHAKCTVP